MLSHGDAIFAEMFLLVVLVLDGADGLPTGLDADLRGDLLQGIGIDVLNLGGHDVAGLRQFADGFALLEGAGDMVIVGANLLSRGVLRIKDVALDVEAVGRFDQHTAQLASTEDSHLAGVPHIDVRKYRKRGSKNRDGQAPARTKQRGKDLGKRKAAPPRRSKKSAR